MKKRYYGVADAIVINKSDGENIKNTENAASMYRRSIQLFPKMENGWKTKVITCSSIENIGIKEIAANIINDFDLLITKTGWKEENEKTRIFGYTELIKIELGNKKFEELKKELEIKLEKNQSIYSIINSIK